MKTISVKNTYSAPIIERVQLDNEISLVLESVKPDPSEPGIVKVSEHFNNDPFKTTFG